MKKLLFIALLAIVFTSCKKDEDLVTMDLLDGTEWRCTKFLSHGFNASLVFTGDKLEIYYDGKKKYTGEQVYFYEIVTYEIDGKDINADQPLTYGAKYEEDYILLMDKYKFYKKR